jgi:hypothetical protein
MGTCSSLHAIKLDKLLLMPDTHLSHYDMYHGKTPAWAEHLHYFGEMTVVNATTKRQAKLDNKGFPAIYLGPSE